MQDEWDEETPAPDDSDTESEVGELRVPGRMGVIGARAGLLLGIATLGAIGMMPMWPSVSSP